MKKAPMLNISGSSPESLEAVRYAIVCILASQNCDQVKLAALSALSQLCQAPHNITISGNSFGNEP